MLEHRHLNSFVVLAEELHYGRAAERLGVTQPALSQQIRQLEVTLGVHLLERRPRVRLREEGRALLPEARQVLSQLSRCVRVTQAVSRGEAGPLTIGFVASAMATEVPRIIRHYREAYPDVRLELHDLPAAAEAEAVLTGRVEVALVREVSRAPELVYEPLILETLVALLPRGHRLAGRRRLRLESLADEPFVHFPREVAPSLYDEVLRLCRDAGFSPRIVQEVREWLTEISLVRAGLGVALVPSSLERLRLPGICFRELLGGGGRAMIGVCYRREGVPAAAAAFVALARALRQPAVGFARSKAQRSGHAGSAKRAT